MENILLAYRIGCGEHDDDGDGGCLKNSRRGSDSLSHSHNDDGGLTFNACMTIKWNAIC